MRNRTADFLFYCETSGGITMMLCTIILAALVFWAADWKFNRFEPKLSIGFAQGKPFLASPIHITVIVYLVFHYCWHLFWLMVSLPDAGAMHWHTPMVSGITLADVERAVLAGLMTLVAIEFWFRECKSRRLRAADCLVAATETVFLGYTMLAMPQHGG